MLLVAVDFVAWRVGLLLHRALSGSCLVVFAAGILNVVGGCLVIHIRHVSYIIILIISLIIYIVYNLSGRCGDLYLKSNYISNSIK